MAGFFSCTEDSYTNNIMLYFVTITFSCQNIYEIALFKVSSLVEHIVENYWSKFDVTGKQMNVQLE